MGAIITTSPKAFYEWETRSEDTVYQADEDGFFIGIIGILSGAGLAWIQGRADNSNPPTFAHGFAFAELINGTYVMSDAFCIPVKKGDYYKSVYAVKYGTPVTTRTYKWRPMK